MRFGYLKEPQAAELFQRACRQLGLAAPQPNDLARLARLTRPPALTPGDVATVLRQARLRPLDDAHALIAALEAEQALKGRAD